MLTEQLKEEAIFQSKLSHIGEIYKSFKSIRPDGNCFYRATFVGLIQNFVNQGIVNQSKDFFESIAVECKSEAYDSFSIDEFQESLNEQLDYLIEQPDPQTFLDTEMLADPSVDGYIMAFMRCACGTALKKWSEEFTAFLPEPYTSIQAFCRSEVDPMYRDADHLQVAALSKILHTTIRIVYLDKSPGEEANIINFGDESNDCTVHLLYRPGHYDLLFPE